MERKLNAFHKSKSRSQPDLYKVTADGKLVSGKNRSIDDELFHLCALSNVRFDVDVFKIMIDLLRLNVNPNTLLDVFRKMASARGMKPSKSSDNIARIRKSEKEKSASKEKSITDQSNYAVYLESAAEENNSSRPVDLI